MTMSSASQETPRRPISAAIFSRRGRIPSVVPYCRARGPSSPRARPAAARTSSTGKSSGAGSPPAREMKSGRSVTFRISRIVEGFMADMRLAKWFFMAVPPSGFAARVQARHRHEKRGRDPDGSRPQARGCGDLLAGRPRGGPASNQGYYDVQRDGKKAAARRGGGQGAKAAEGGGVSHERWSPPFGIGPATGIDWRALYPQRGGLSTSGRIFPRSLRPDGPDQRSRQRRMKRRSWARSRMRVPSPSRIRIRG